MVSCMQQKDEFCFHIQSVSLYLFIGELSPFIVRDNNDQGLLSPVKLFFVVGDVILCVFLFLEFASVRSPSTVCVFVDVANFLGLLFYF